MFAVAVAAAVAYSSWVLEWFLPGGVDPLRSYASELAAVAEPHGTLFARADTASGTLLVALGGAAVVVVAPGTADPGRVGAVGWRDRGRFVFPHAHGHHRRPGGVGGADGGREVGGAGAFALLVDGGRGHGAGRRGLWLLARDRAGRMLAGVFLALLAMVAVTSGLHEVGGPNLWLGLWQRLSLAVAAAVIVTVVVAVTSAGSTARREAS